MSRKQWRPRASSLASYMYCQMRAAYDRAYAMGDLTAEPTTEVRDTKYADLGTMIHLALQRELGCVFDTPPEEIPAEVSASAAALFGGDQTRLAPSVQAAVNAAKAVFPLAPDGLPWRAEVDARTKMLTGHIDFLSQDGKVIVDLKTTSRKPDHNRVKGEHYLQMLAYKILMPTVERAHILYVDSVTARWAMLSRPIDFTTPDAQSLLERIPTFLRRIKAPKIYTTAIPAPGGHCSGCFCPYTTICKDNFIPGPGAVVDHTPVTATPRCAEAL